ncbi:hypothetical protein NQ318_017543 [Aromia moschata]|uniref:Uncharacterized protein n=1 Tax=Aromia moschata TaxID=1265417 RepID=A0AAV8Z165_9CUCU|nr:hypothetical protein NQ318_017543 [Aromia moschata]
MFLVLFKSRTQLRDAARDPALHNASFRLRKCFIYMPVSDSFSHSSVKAGSMKITQHKTRRDSGGIAEDVTDLTVSRSPPKTTTVCGAVLKEHADFPAEAV